MGRGQHACQAEKLALEKGKGRQAGPITAEKTVSIIFQLCLSSFASQYDQAEGR